jgi:hypothetical protein
MVPVVWHYRLLSLTPFPSICEVAEGYVITPSPVQVADDPLEAPLA